MSDRSLTAVGAYVYAGGFSVGVRRAGFDVVAHLEGDNGYGVSSARLNWPDLPIHFGPSRWPLRDLSDRQIDFLYVNPPCAIFSPLGIVTTRGADSWRDDDRLQHWFDCVRALEEVEPRAWALESVCQAYSRGRPVVDEITKRALVRGYSVTHLFVDAKWHGIPQSRKRMFVVAHRPARLAGYAPARNWAPPPTVGEVLETIREPGVGIEVNPRYVAALAITPPGGGLTDAWMKLNPDAESHRNARGKVIGRPSFQDQRLDGSSQMGAFVGHKFYHPTENRSIGIAEAMALCGYPPDFKLAGPITGLQSLLARAVMPPVGEWLGRSIAATLTQADASWNDRTVTLVDVREPNRAPVDLTGEYLDDGGRVRLRARADGTIDWTAGRTSYSAPKTTVGAPKPAIRSVVPATVGASPTVAESVPVELFGSPETTAAVATRTKAPAADPSGEAASSAGPLPRPDVGEGSGRFIQRLWRETDLSVDAILAAVHASYAGRTTARGDVYYNYRKLVDAGEVVRPWSSDGRGRPRKNGNASATTASPRGTAVEPTRQGAATDSGRASGIDGVLLRGDTAAAPALAAPAGLAARSTVVPERVGVVDRALLYFSKLPEPGSVASPISSARIAWFLQGEIEFDAVYHSGAYSSEVVPAKINELWVVNSSWMWVTDEWRRVHMRYFSVADRIVFVQNDYALILNSYHLGVIRPDANYVVLSTAPENPYQLRHGTNPHLVNWNVLTYEPRRESDGSRRSGIYYYGSFRAGRKKIFDRYFSDPPTSLVVSASNAADVNRFRTDYPKLEIVSRADDVFQELESWEATLVLEDDRATAFYCSPPNRFYEALSARTPMIFDRSSVPMFNRYGFNVANAAIDGPRQLESALARASELTDAQAEWHRDFRGELRAQLAEARVRLARGELGRRGAPEHLKRYVLTEDGGTY